MMLIGIINPWLKGDDCKSSPTVAKLWAYPKKQGLKTKTPCHCWQRGHNYQLPTPEILNRMSFTTIPRQEIQIRMPVTTIPSQEIQIRMVVTTLPRCEIQIRMPVTTILSQEAQIRMVVTTFPRLQLVYTEVVL